MPPAAEKRTENLPATIPSERALELCDKLEAVATTALAQLDVDAGPFKKMARMAIAIQQFKDALTDEFMKLVIMPLANTKLGFTTDRDPNKPGSDGKAPTPYDITVVRQVLVEGALQKARWTGNEITIIAGGLYLTKQYYERMVREYPGVSNVNPKAGVATMVGDDGALVPYVIEWDQVIDGKTHRRRMERLKVSDAEDYRIVVRKNRNMGVDGLLGKARKRAFAAVWSMLTGKEPDNIEPDDANTIDVPAGSVRSSPTAESPKKDPSKPNDSTGNPGQTAENSPSAESLFGKQDGG